VVAEGERRNPGVPNVHTRLPIRLGITTPVLTLLPGWHAPWEVDGDIEDVALIARTAESLGYFHLTCSEHVLVPTEVAATRGSRYWDPLATFGYLAAVTTRIRLATNVLVLGYHHPLEIAKRYGTLDQVASGRLILGLGVGSLQEEFDLLGVDFEGRGARADDALSALRVSLSTNRPQYDGRFYRYSDVVVDPCARQQSVPLWIGGRTARSLRRAVELADGWVPFSVRADDVGTMIDQARTTPAWAARTSPLEVVLRNGRLLDPLGDPDGARKLVERLTGVGATGLQLGFAHDSRGHYLEQLDAMAQLVGEMTAMEVPGPG
jgi:probable F420-dependent oxidoreductase